jgi:hypothetical protein
MYNCVYIEMGKGQGSPMQTELELATYNANASVRTDDSTLVKTVKIAAYESPGKPIEKFLSLQ